MFYCIPCCLFYILKFILFKNCNKNQQLITKCYVVFLNVFVKRKTLKTT